MGMSAAQVRLLNLTQRLAETKLKAKNKDENDNIKDKNTKENQEYKENTQETKFSKEEIDKQMEAIKNNMIANYNIFQKRV